MDTGSWRRECLSSVYILAISFSTIVHYPVLPKPSLQWRSLLNYDSISIVPPSPRDGPVWIRTDSFSWE